MYLKVICVFSLLSAPAFAVFESDIFAYKDLTNAKGLTVKLLGENWVAESVSEKDVPFHQQLFSDPKVMAQFGTGEPLPPAKVAERLKEIWIPRFDQGHPHGGLTVFLTDELKTPIGHSVAGAGEGEGACEVAQSYMPDYWGKGFGTSVRSAMVTVWAPEVRRIGLGQGGLQEQDMHIIEKFRCFGGKPLSRMDATASPTNVGSWKILDKTGFGPASDKVPEESCVVDFPVSYPELTSNEMMVSKLKELHSEQELVQGQRHRMVDIDGQERTFSFHEKWGCIKYHFEKKIE